MAESEPAETPDMLDLLEELEDLSETVDSPEAQSQIEETMAMAREVQHSSVFGRVIHGFDRADAAEALVGAVVFGIPMIIEGGTLEVGEFIARHPVFHVGTFLFGVAVVIGLLYVAEIQHVEVARPLFGVIPRRLAGVLAISFLTSFALMTAWGRVNWSTPGVAFAQIVFVFVGMSIGASLTDILPGS